MKALLKQNAFTGFVFRAGILYLLFFFIYQFVIRRYTYYDQKFIASIIHVSEFILNTFGIRTFKDLLDQDVQVIGLDGGTGVWIGSNCNAITLFSLFAIFIVAYPGNTKGKIWFIPVGILAIHFLNILRIIALMFINKFAPQYLDFNHTYTFTFIVYAFIFWLWMIWINKFANKPIAPGK